MLKSCFEVWLMFSKTLEDHRIGTLDVDDNLPFLCSRDDGHALARRCKLKYSQDFVLHQDLSRNSDDQRVRLADLKSSKCIFLTSFLFASKETEGEGTNNEFVVKLFGALDNGSFIRRGGLVLDFYQMGNRRRTIGIE